MNNLIYIYFIIINIVGFYFMYIDKRKAIKNEWRISEATLISIAIIGGSLGSLLGMYTFRHKTKHPKFTIGIPFIILLQIGIFII
ncbi:DUF1294 domain-containing protein [[Clostridium] dakarense]|uniref:DUF1294 domain-containing protein n=1 Tax=Faecalimicrobium dakarense TaxID=1301100 RepID=UPI0005A62561|nr:DUF1294 domain-containing protein [[Clostridium] dakarense]